MKEEQDKWIEGFRNRMKDYSVPVPEQLWEQLSAELDKPKIVPFYAYWRVVAAVAVCLLVTSFAVWYLYSPSSDYIKEVAEQVNVRDDRTFIKEEPVAQVVVPQREKVSNTIMKINKTTIEPEKVEEEEEKGDDAFIPRTKEEPEKYQEQPISRNHRKDSGYSFTATSRQRHQSWEVGAFVGNTPLSTSYTSPGYRNLPHAGNQASYFVMSDVVGDGGSGMTDAASGEAYALGQILSNKVRTMVVSDIKHHMPITAGVTVRFHFNGRWAVESGVLYTLLSSDIRSGGESYSYKTEQKLHYVGIPLKLSYEVWEKNNFSFYVSMGGAVEKCVAGKAKTMYVTGNEKNTYSSESIDVKPLQCSLSAAAGVQFKLSKQIGLYAEPGVAYYFDDGSSVETIRKEHPFNFNLQLGIRISH